MFNKNVKMHYTLLNNALKIYNKQLKSQNKKYQVPIRNL